MGPAVPEGARLAQGGVEEKGKDEAHSAASNWPKRSGAGRPRRSQVRE
jgi:hypothetical protein